MCSGSNIGKVSYMNKSKILWNKGKLVNANDYVQGPVRTETISSCVNPNSVIFFWFYSASIYKKNFL